MRSEFPLTRSNIFGCVHNATKVVKERKKKKKKSDDAPMKSGSAVNKTRILVNPTMEITGNLTRCKSKACLRNQSRIEYSRGLEIFTNELPESRESSLLQIHNLLQENLNIFN